MISPAMCWPVNQISEPAAILARSSGFANTYEIAPIVTAFPNLPRQLGAGGPAIVRVPDGLLAIRRVGRYRTVVITPDNRRCRLPTSVVIESAATVAPAVITEVDKVLDLAGLRPGRRRQVVRGALIDARLVDQRIDAGWMVRPTATAPWHRLVRSVHLGRWIVVLVLAHLATYALFLATFAVVGGAAARGDLRASTVSAGSLLLLAAVPMRMTATWSAGQITMGVGGLIKRRLHAGIVNVEPDEMRHHGAGHFLALVLEAEAVETLFLTGGHAALIAIVELIAASVAIAAGIRAPALIGLLVVWVAVAMVVARCYLRRRSVWTDARAELTGGLVEQMTGHRTRLAQEGPSLYDTSAEEATIGDYDEVATAMDRPAIWLRGGLARSWMLVGLGVLVLPGNDGADPARLAAAFGGLLLAFHALDSLVISAGSLTDATVAWRRVSAILRPRRAPQPDRSPAIAGDPGYGKVEFAGIEFDYGGRSVLRAVDFTIHPGDRVLIEGPSGAGKSTLAALLGGLRQPCAGLTSGINGVGLVPQFHENHILSASLAFNLLVGRQWPPTDDDLIAAWQVCEELGLGELLARMPAGIEQPVGECGWQLSHGERSRIFIARALLQRAPVLVLDESFAALDPAALRQTVAAVLGRAKTVIAIAHE